MSTHHINGKNFFYTTIKPVNHKPTNISLLTNHKIYSKNLIGNENTSFIELSNNYLYLNLSKNFFNDIIIKYGYQDEFNKISPNILNQINNGNHFSTENTFIDWYNIINSFSNNNSDLIKLFTLYQFGFFNNIYHSKLISKNVFDNPLILTIMNKYKTSFESVNMNALKLFPYFIERDHYDIDTIINFFDSLIINSSNKELQSFFKKLSKIKTNFGTVNVIDLFNYPRLKPLENLLQKHADKIPEFVKTNFLMFSKFSKNKNELKEEKFSPFLMNNELINFEISFNHLKPFFNFSLTSNNLETTLSYIFKILRKENLIDGYVITRGNLKYKDNLYITVMKGKHFHDNLINDISNIFIKTLNHLNENSKLNAYSSSKQISPEEQEIIAKSYREYFLQKTVDKLEKNNDSETVKRYKI